MPKPESDPSTPTPESKAARDLREKAEAVLRNLVTAMPDAAEHEPLRLLHELQVYQAELEIQNEELKRARGEAEDLLAQYTDLYENAPVGYLTLTKDGILKSVNSLAAAILEDKPGDLLESPLDCLITETSRPVLQSFLQSTFAGSANPSCEVSLLGRDRPARIMRLTASASVNDQRCRVVVMDVTASREKEVALEGTCDELERVVSEKTTDLAASNEQLKEDLAKREQILAALAESENRYRRLLASITSYVYTVELADGTVIRTTHGEGCAAVSGYTSDDYDKNPLLWLIMVPEQDRPVVTTAMDEILTSRDPITIEHRIQHLNGQLRWIRNTLVPHWDLRGVLTSYDGIITDITEQRDHEAERVRLAHEARQGETLRALGQLAAGVAHEVRSPLNAIIISAELLAEDLKGTPDCLPHLDRIQRQIRRLDNLMKDLLELRRPAEARNLQIHAVGEICRKAIEIWQLSSADNRHCVVTNLESNPAGEVLVDMDRMIQVMVNLLDNAAQHSSPRADISVSVREAHDGYVGIQVQDHGAGLSAEGLRYAFDPYFTSRKGGSGMGLSIVKHIVETYHGQVTIQNAPSSSGCIVEIRLPVAS